MTLAIIGSAGRSPAEASLLTLPRWNDMKRCVYRFVKEGGFTSMISGASAWTDHMAVGLFNAELVSGLTLAIPCQFGWEQAEFVHGYESGAPAHRLNQLHAQFSAVIGKPSLQEIKTAIYRGAKVEQRRGFHERNTVVAERSDVMIAFTFGHGATVADGGTADTCRKYLDFGKTYLWHVDLNDMTLHEDGRVE